PTAPGLAAPLLGMTDDPEPKVAFQLLLTLGELRTPEAAAARERLLFQTLEDGGMQVAALSAAGLDAPALFGAAVDRLGARETPGATMRLGRVAGMIAAGGDAAEIGRVVE